MRFIVVWDDPEFDKSKPEHCERLERILDHDDIMTVVGVSYKKTDKDIQTWALIYKLLFTCVGNGIWKWPRRKKR